MVIYVQILNKSTSFSVCKKITVQKNNSRKGCTPQKLDSQKPFIPSLRNKRNKSFEVELDIIHNKSFLELRTL